MVKPNFGDVIELVTKEKKYVGRFVPSPKKEIILIKLDSGYNIGILKKKVKGIKIIKKFEKKKRELKKIVYKSDLPTVMILHTGGTLASKVSYETGGVVAKFKPEEIIEMFPELCNIVNIKSKFISNMWSQDMRFEHYNIIAKEIKKELDNGNVDGIIITHGTDTMHYTSAALSFILDGLNVPVLLVGSQRSSDRGSSDAAMNLICACHFISKVKDFADVAICMHATISDDKCYILPGCRSRKMHTSRRDAFKSINCEPFAEVSYPDGKVKIINNKYNKKDPNKKLKLMLFNEKIKVGIVKAHTNMYVEQFYPYKKYDGLVIEATGLGNLPTTKIDKYTKENAKIFDFLKELSKKTVIVLAPQTIYGRLNLNVYENQRKMKKIGIIGDYLDMTPETAFIKLAWALSNFPKKKAIEIFQKDIRGELS